MPSTTVTALQPTIDAIRHILQNAGNPDVSSTGPWDSSLDEALAATIAALQQDPVWGWSIAPDGIPTSEFLDHLAHKVTVVSSSEQGFPEVVVLVPAIRRLQASRVIRDANPMQVAAVSFANAISSGSAPSIISWWQNREQPSARRTAVKDFGAVVVYGQRYHPRIALVFTVLGTIPSVLGSIAMFLAKSEPTPGKAFRLVFAVEFIEWLMLEYFQASMTGVAQISMADFWMVLASATGLGILASTLPRKAQT